MNDVIFAGVVFVCACLQASEAGRGLTLFRQRQFAPAEAEFRRLLATSPRDDATRLYLARTLIELDRRAEALGEIEKILARSSDPDIRFQAGAILREMAELRFADLERAAPNSAAVRELAGRRHEMRGHLEEALREYRAAAALDPRRPGIHYRIGGVLWRRRELEVAVRELKAELALSPHHAMANLRLGQVLIAQSEEVKAIRYLERAVHAMPDSVDARRELGKAYRKAQRAADARREWETVARARPGDDQVHFLLGNLYRELGEAAASNREFARHREILERRRALAERR